MATGRIGVTPTLGTRWSKAPAGGTTSLSGLDDNSVSLVYSVGYEQVYRNGVLLSRGNDYTATTGNSITLIDATIAGDIIEVFANELVPLTDAISKGQFTAKGALLSATAASTPGVLAVGTNGQYLQADSAESTGLKWATLSSGGYTLISEQTASSSTGIDFTSISSTYKTLILTWSGLYYSDGSTDFEARFNSDSGSNYAYSASGFFGNSTVANTSAARTSIGNGNDVYLFGQDSTSSTLKDTSKGFLRIENANSTTKLKYFNAQNFYVRTSIPYTVTGFINGIYNSTSAISSINIVRLNGTGTLTNATNTSIQLWGLS